MFEHHDQRDAKQKKIIYIYLHHNNCTCFVSGFTPFYIINRSVQILFDHKMHLTPKFEKLRIESLIM